MSDLYINPAGKLKLVNWNSWLVNRGVITGLKYIASDSSLKVFLCTEWQGLFDKKDIFYYAKCIDFSTLKNEVK